MVTLAVDVLEDGARTLSMIRGRRNMERPGTRIRTTTTGTKIWTMSGPQKISVISAVVPARMWKMTAVRRGFRSMMG